MGSVQSTTQVFEVTIEPGSMDYDLLIAAVDVGRPVTLRCSAPWDEPMFVHGDKVEVPFDHGYGPATVHYATEALVCVTYGPRQKYRTSVERTSVITDRKREYPARVEVTE